jgi:hypothetical protein
VNTWCTKNSDDIKPGGTVAASNAAILRSTSLFVAGRSHGGLRFDVRVGPARCAGALSSSAHRAPLAEPDSLATKNKSGNVPGDHCLARIQQQSDAVL